MFRTSKLSATLLVFAFAAGPGLAQEDKDKKVEVAKAATPAEQPKFYRLDFLVQEVEGGKIVNGRAYSMIVSTASGGPPASMRTGNRLPIQAGGNFQYFDVGVNIDCREVRELENRLSLTINADISSVVTGPESTETTTAPVVRNTRWASGVIVPIKKPTIIFSSDDATSKRKMQLELTATPIQ
ncbi:MAG: hypothetical protein ACRD7E_03700 [Bryobacteraceae bacterium]